METIQEGKGGDFPQEGDYLWYFYKVYLSNGELFEERLKDEVTLVLGSGKNITGLEMALTRMKVGQKCRVYIPSALAYAEHGAQNDSGSIIPPNENLEFELTLVNMAQKGSYHLI